jgi:hypothetical protein
MPNTIDNLVLENDGVYYKHRYLCLSDGTAMTDVVAVDKSTLVSKETGVEPKALDLIEFDAIAWGTVNSVLLEWDHTTDDEVLAFGSGANAGWCFDRGPLKDPRSAGDTGDVVITTNGLAANAGFQFYAVWKLRD